MSTQARPDVQEIGTTVGGVICHSPDVRRIWVSILADGAEIWLETADIDAEAELALYGCVDALADLLPDFDVRLHLLHPRRLTLPVGLAIPARAVEIPRPIA